MMTSEVCDPHYTTVNNCPNVPWSTNGCIRAHLPVARPNENHADVLTKKVRLSLKLVDGYTSAFLVNNEFKSYNMLADIE